MAFVTPWSWSTDEALIFAIAAVSGSIWAQWWYSVAWSMRAQGRLLAAVWMAMAPIVEVGGVGFTIHRWADPGLVAGHVDYEVFFDVVGVAFILGAPVVLSMTGVSLCQDALARTNGAALVTLLGAQAGAALSYAGANIGAGSTIWSTLWPALIGQSALITLWMAEAWLGQSSEQITIERSWAAGWRSAGLSVASGLILGRAEAGDFTGYLEMLRDWMKIGWPVTLLFAWTLLMDRWAQPTRMKPQRSVWGYGLLPFCGSVILAMIWLFRHSWP